MKRWRETLPNGVSYTTLDLIDNGFYDNTQEYVVPAGHYFMMGDNRDNSTDSRVLSQVGYVPFQNLVGRAQLIFFSRRRRRARVADLALAVDDPLESAVLDRAMSRKAESRAHAGAAAPPAPPSKAASAPKAPAAASVAKAAPAKSRRNPCAGPSPRPPCLRRPSAIAFPIRICSSARSRISPL